MDVVVIGGHGKIGLRLLGLLAARGDRARGVIRKPEQAADLEKVGAEALVVDMESEDLTEEHLAGADAAVFAAGAGPGSGTERKRTVDYGAAVKLIEACRAHGVSRYLMVSAIGVGRDPSEWPEQMVPYYEAKADADAELLKAGLDHTIVRPGGLTDDPGTGTVEIAPQLEHSGQVPRDDVAAVLAEALVAENTIKKAFDLISGETPIAEALRTL
jgi:uncharacterized protein YbjT (DUF2867 family)